MKFTTVSVRIDTRDKLRLLGSSGESIDKIIRRLIEHEDVQHRKDNNHPGSPGGTPGGEEGKAGGGNVDEQ